MTTHANVAAAGGLPEPSTTPRVDLECQIEDLRNIARVMRIVVEDTIFPRGLDAEVRVKRACPELAGYVVLVLTEDQAEALNFTALNLIEAAEGLQTAFLATIARSATSARTA